MLGYRLMEVEGLWGLCVADPLPHDFVFVWSTNLWEIGVRPVSLFLHKREIEPSSLKVYGKRRALFGR